MAMNKRRMGQIVAAAVALALIAGVALALLRGPRKPPNIFDTPIDGVADYLLDEDFSKLTVQERLTFLRELYERFKGLEQSESAALSSFVAGVTGPAREQARNNVRTLFKDILVEGADGYLALATDEERRKFLDDWLIKYVRFAEEVGGRGKPRTDQEILDRMHRQARRDVEREFEVNATDAQQMIDLWQTEVSVVASPKEQGKIFHFLPALREHLLRPR
jgi:hypothetical protein